MVKKNNKGISYIICSCGAYIPLVKKNKHYTNERNETTIPCIRSLCTNKITVVFSNNRNNGRKQR